ncbi:hypothetical protein CN918_25320 [Priestia megaterium]|nr:hypothetical protein CN918_25320 [Priestia megaterium]
MNGLLRKYRAKLHYPLDAHVESELYSHHILAYGEWGDREVIIKTFKTKEELLTKEKDVRDITEELTLSPEEMAQIKFLYEQLESDSQQEFLQTYYLMT